VFTDPAEWRVSQGNRNRSLELTYDRKAKPAYQPKHRSPFHIALIADKVVGDFVLDVRLRTTVEPYGHQDMCVFYGFESPEKYYYTHIAREADPHAHNVFLVNGADRKAIAKETTKGVDWKQHVWHEVRIARDAKAGTIKVYFEDMTKPIMTAEDKTFPKGYVGVGSFDDTGLIDDIFLWAPSVEDKKATFFEKAKPEGAK
jgi:hypothetical protein